MGFLSFPPINLPSATDDKASPPLAELARKNGPDLLRDKENITDAAWYHPDVIDGKRWDQTFPYQFLVLDRQDDGTYRRRGDWVYTLPIPPESLTIGLGVAARVSVTQGGVVEELAGIPLRSIDIQGTVGVLPARPAPGQPARPGLLGAVFAGTIAAAGRVAAAASDTLDDLSGEGRRSTNLIPDDLLTDGGAGILRNTGYYQARTMMRFLEAFFNLRRTSAGQRAVLAFAMWKEEAVYLVSPTRPPTLRRGADSPLEYRYSIGLTAWGRTVLDGPGATRNSQVQDGQSPNALAAALNALTDARLVLQEARATIGAVLTDLDRAVFEPIREAVLLIKDALSIPIALIDLPASIVRDTADAVIAAVSAGQDILDFPDTVKAEARVTSRSIQDDIARIKAIGAEVRDRTTVSTGTGAARARTLASGGTAVRAGRPTFDAFDRPEAHSELMAAVRPDRLRLPLTVTARITEERERVRALSRADLVSRGQGLEAAGAAFEDLVGAGDASAAPALGRPPPQSARALTATGARVSAALSEAVVAYAVLSARGPVTADGGAVASVQAFATRSREASTPFQVPRSKFAVPLPFGETLDQVAQRYLGDPNRVGEIIALNGLRTPYIDEVGVQFPLLAPGAGRTVVVADSADLYVGQTAWVESAAQPRTKRRVTSISRLAGQATLVLDGTEDLDRYSTLQGAQLHVFRPGTVNSQMLLWIPSDQEPDGSFRVSGVADASVFDPLVSAGGVDLLLTPQNDLVVTPDGDGRFAVGLTNLTQLFRILVTLRRGTLLGHPDRGLPIRPGDSVADVPASTVASALRQTLAAEPAFGVLTSVTVDLRPPTCRIEATTNAGGTGITVPLAVEISR